VRHLHRLPATRALRYAPRFGGTFTVQRDFPAIAKGNVTGPPYLMTVREFLRLNRPCAKNGQSACRHSFQEFTPGLHMHLAANNFMYVNHKLWSLNADGIQSRH